MKQYKDFIDIHKGKDIIVCGCGKSITELKNPQDFITVGVNDIGRLFCPDYLVVLNNKQGFKGGRWKYVQETESPVILTHLKGLQINNKKNITQISLGTYGKLTSLKDKSKVDYTNNSPYVGVVIAYHLGAKRIGLLGVDFTNDHFFGNTGRHPLAGRLSSMLKEYRLLGKTLKVEGVELYNLSSQSLIKTLPHISLKEFQHGK